MLIISSRQNFNNSDKLHHSGHMFKEVDLSNDKVVRNFEQQQEFVKELVGRKILLLVHGYNNEQDEVYDAYSIIEDKIHAHLNKHYDLVVGYSWPGGDSGLDWWASKKRANAVARRFRFLIEDIHQYVPYLDVMSHSLGARVVFKALKQTKVRHLIRNYHCTAPAIDNEALEKGEEFYEAVNKMQALYVFHSKKDAVLAGAYRVAEFDNALGLYGPEDKQYIQNRTSNIYVANCKRKIDSHGSYKYSDALYNYINQSIIKKPIKFRTL